MPTSKSVTGRGAKPGLSSSACISIGAQSISSYANVSGSSARSAANALANTASGLPLSLSTHRSSQAGSLADLALRITGVSRREACRSIILGLATEAIRSRSPAC